MKRWTRYTWMTVLTTVMMSMTACNSDVDNPLAEPDDNTPIVYESDELVLHVSKKGQLLSTETWDENHQIGVFLTQGQLGMPYRNDTLAYSNIKATMKAGAWMTNPLKIKLTEEKAVVYAYSPFRNDADPFAIYVDAMQQIPFMYGSHIDAQEYVNSGHNFAGIELENAMAMLELNFKKTPGYQGEIVVDQIAFIPVNDKVQIPITGTMNIQTGQISPLSYGSYRLQHLKLNLQDDYTDDCRIRMLVIPRMNDNGEVKLAMRINGTEISMNLTDEQDWVKGVRSVYNISCGTKKGTFDNFFIREWEDFNLEGELTKHD